MRVLRKCLEPQRVTEKDEKDSSEPTVQGVGGGEKRKKKSVDVTILQRERER